MIFSREIGYLDYFYNGLKLSSVGMVKWQRLDNECSMELFFHIEDFSGSMLKVFLVGKGGQRLFREIEVNHGAANMKYLHIKADNLFEDGGSYEDYGEVYIPIEKGWYLSGRYRASSELTDEVKTEKKYVPRKEGDVKESILYEGDNQGEDATEAENREDDGIEFDNIEEETIQSDITEDDNIKDDNIKDDNTEFDNIEFVNIKEGLRENVNPEVSNQGQLQDAVNQEIYAQEIRSSEADDTNTTQAARVEKGRIRELKQEEFGDTKWETLYKILPKRIPFQDDRRFLECMLEDLICLSEKNFRYCKNPFLLYGYRQYGHLLLGRIGQGRTHNYLLGVPGIYHPQEIQAALNYGFESFEGVDKNQPEGQEGRQGYYFARVSL